MLNLSSLCNNNSWIEVNVDALSSDKEGVSSACFVSILCVKSRSNPTIDIFENTGLKLVSDFQKSICKNKWSDLIRKGRFSLSEKESLFNER